MNYKYITKFAVKVVERTGRWLANELKKYSTDKTEVKGPHDFVSYADRTAEEMLVSELEELLPEAGFIAEEGTSDKKGDVYNWIIDPLDGTTNFIHGLLPFSVSVALQENGKTVIGIVYEAGASECFSAFKGGGAFLNDEPISVSKTQKVADSLIGTGFPYYDYNRMPQFLKTLEFFMQNSHGIRRPGSAATDLAYVACGRFDAFYEYGLSPWDVAAGAFIVQEAGGVVSDYTGGDDYVFGKEIIATNNNVYNEFYKVVNQIMNTPNS